MSNNLGLDYFNIDVGIFEDAKIVKLIHRYGPLGFTIYLVILSQVYRNGYYLEYGLHDLSYLLLSKINGKFISGKNKLQEIILFLAELKLIDSKMLKQNVFTSTGIQKRFLLMTKKRKNQDLSNYWLLDSLPNLEEKDIEEPEEEIEILSPKEKKLRKIKEQRIKDTKEHAPNKHYLTSCLITYKYIDEYSLDIFKYNNLFEELVNQYDQDMLYDTVRYLCNYASRKATKIDDKYNFFASSIKTNLEQIQNRSNGSNAQSFDDFIQGLMKNA